jgi:RHS repeat-associated protein
VAGYARWRGAISGAYHQGDATGGDWVGSLIPGMQDASGLLYKRNRYYSPETGQFTQVDPIGLAGGLNTYGFAGGEPISFDDPYGLCPKIGSSSECPLVLPELVVVVRVTPLRRMEHFDEYSILIGGGIAGRGVAPARALLFRLGAGLRQLLARQVMSHADRALLREFFGQGMKGVRERAADFTIPQGLGREALMKYRQVATEAIEKGIDKSGVQAERIKLIDRALETLP